VAADPVLELIGLSRHFVSGGETIRVLDGLDLEVAAGERVAIMGASGSGKSTLLHLAAGMDQPDDGNVRLEGKDLAGTPEPRRTRLRAAAIGLVFQDFNLIDSLSAAENIELPMWLNRRPVDEDRMQTLAAELGIAELLERLPGELSGGEQQRVAIARALIHEPRLLLADEPTGALDQVTASGVLDLFDRVTAGRDCALVMVTHNPEAARFCDRTLWLRQGRLETE
jgi:ABC-type lipoprotein export system ATPase subunit